MKDQELILRFLAFFYGYENYSAPMKDFLNLFMQDNRELDKATRDDFEGIFNSTIEVVHESLGDRPFRPERNLNAAVFDSMMVGIARRLIRGPLDSRQEIETRYNSLLEDEEYKDSYRKSTANEDNVATRFSKAVEYFETVN